ncbi:heme ABC exporter ATP-binding protein CcmA [Candidatus Neomarinimicrobiota bacterium]
MTPLFTAERITKSFHRQPVLNEVSFSLSEGEVVILIGRNGCGKTTLLRILAGVMRPEGGSANLRGQDLFTTDSRWRHDMVYLGHRPNLYPAFSARENLRLSVQLRGQAWDEQTFQSLLARYELTGRENDPIRAYSEGMLQRLGLIRLELATWKLALMDEPSSALDVDGEELLKSTIAGWRSQGRTVLFTSHDLTWGADCADRAVLLENGTITKQLERPDGSELINLLGSGRE